MFFIIPIELVQNPHPRIPQGRRVKYLPDMNVTRAICHFADTGIVFVRDTNITEEQLAQLMLNSDVIQVTSEMLDIQIGSDLTKFQTALEAQHLPAKWVTASMTYRAVLRMLVGMAMLIQRCNFHLQSRLPMAGNLDKTVSQMSSNIRQKLSMAVESLGFDKSAITGATTIRSALAIIGKQCVDKFPIALGDL